MIKSIVIGIIILLGNLQVIAQDNKIVNPLPQPSCFPEFIYKDGWLGGDGAYSIKLTNNKILWLFQDTAIGNNNSINRNNAQLVRNTIGVSSCEKKAGWEINYYWGDNTKENPEPFFKPLNGNWGYWPIDGFIYNHKLYICLNKIVNKSTEEDELFNFESIGTDLAIISNYKALPSKWKIEYRELSKETHLGVGTSAIKQGNYILFFSYYDSNGENQFSIFLTRIRLKRLNNPAKYLEYYTKDNRWKLGFDPDKAKIIISNGISETSIRYHSEIKQWIAIAGPKFLSNIIYISFADKLTGPWSKAEPIFSIPEMQPSNIEYDMDTFCYAGKEHIEFHNKGYKILITYVCNSSNLEKLLRNMNIYKPRPVLVEFKFNGK
jgi:hypothetical protein